MGDNDHKVAERKTQHLRAFDVDKGIERNDSGFDRIALSHRALPEVNLRDIDTACVFLGKELSFPLLISSMTGGTGAEVAQINENLARAAEATGVAMAVGSQRVMFTDPDANESFRLRALAPTVPLIANIGAVQLNLGLGAKECREAIDVLGADGLYLHLNPLQEAVQPEGDTDFRGLAAKIEELVAELPVPVLLKEVGCGLSVPDLTFGLNAGVRHFDVAGRGGTSWSRIEYHRRQSDSDDLGLVFQDWGLQTVDSLRQAQAFLSTREENSQLIASGGIRNGIDMAKAVILGADLCGVAAPLLRAAQISANDVVAAINKLHMEFKTAMFLLGCANVAALHDNHALIQGQGENTK